MEITLRERFSAIGHRTFVFHGPCAPATFENLVAACAPHLRAFGGSHAHAPAQAQAHAHTHAEVEVCTERHYTGPILLDAGCGRAELTLRLLEIEPNMSAVGVDSSQHATQTAILQGMGRVAPGRLRVMCEGFNADKHRCKTGYEGFVCVGSEHVCGGWEKTIATARDLLGTRGLCVLGMLCWERTPPEDVEGMMGDAGSIPMHGDLVREFEREFEKFFSHTVADEEWATYQDGYIANFDDYLRANPCDPDLGWIAERRSQLEQMHTATKGWLGFVLLAGTRRQ